MEITPLKVGALYRHYKGKNYKIIGLGRHSDTLEEYVVYQGQYDSEEFGRQPIWVKPVKGFLEMVVVDGKQVARFQLLV